MGTVFVTRTPLLFTPFTVTWSKCIPNHLRWWHFALYVSGFCHIHDKTPRGILPVNSYWLFTFLSQNIRLLICHFYQSLILIQFFYSFRCIHFLSHLFSFSDSQYRLKIIISFHTYYFYRIFSSVSLFHTHHCLLHSP